jgi:hypothetical protein
MLGHSLMYFVKFSDALHENCRRAADYGDVTDEAEKKTKGNLVAKRTSRHLILQSQYRRSHSAGAAVALDPSVLSVQPVVS